MKTVKETSDFTIVKRDGSADRFSLDKIMNAIIKAFRSVNEPVSLSNVSKIISRLDLYDGIKVEEIQNLVEEALMREGIIGWQSRSCSTGSAMRRTAK